MHAINRKYLLILPEGNTGYAIEGYENYDKDV